MGKILDTFKKYAKWGAIDFAAKYDVKAYDAATGEGIQTHLHDIRSKTGAAIEQLEALLGEKEPSFLKNGGFNKEKTDSVTTDSSAVLATAKAVKTVWDEAISASELADTNKATILSAQKQMQNLSSDGSNVWIADDTGKQSLMVKIPRFKISDVMSVPVEEDGWHPAFIVNGEVKEAIYISKYQNIVENNRAYSLGGEDPRAYINFDQAKSACEAKGTGWHLMTNAEWAAIALWCKKNGTEPLGNNNAGSHYSKKYLCGAESYVWKLSYDWSGRSYKEEPTGTYWHTGRIETGSGPKEFSHTHGLDGIFDLNGNVWEWAGGMRLNNGEIQVIPDNNAAITGTDMSSLSPEWRAILQDGSYVAPGTADTLKIDNTTPNGGSTGNVGGDPVLNVLRENPMADEDTDGYLGYSDVAFKDFGSKVTVPDILKQLGIAPDDNIGGDGLYVRNYGERLPIRGGNWGSTSSAGVFALYLNNARTTSRNDVGFRSAFVF